MRRRSRDGRTAVRLGLTGVRWILRIAAGLVVLAAVLIVVVLTVSYIFNKATNETGTPVEQLWHGSFVEAGGRMNAYREWGSHGSPIVLLGGFLEPSFVWGLVGPQLAAHGHRVYALDLDGFGYTERHGPWTLEGWSDQVEAFTRALGIEDPTIVRPLARRSSRGRDRPGREREADRAASTAMRARSGGPPDILRELVSHTPLVTSALRLSLRWDWPVRKILADAYGAHGPVIDHELVQMLDRPVPRRRRRARDRRAGEGRRSRPVAIGAAQHPGAGDGGLGRGGHGRLGTGGAADRRRPARALRLDPGRRPPCRRSRIPERWRARSTRLPNADGSAMLVLEGRLAPLRLGQGELPAQTLRSARSRSCRPRRRAGRARARGSAGRSGCRRARG